MAELSGIFFEASSVGTRQVPIFFPGLRDKRSTISKPPTIGRCSRLNREEETGHKAMTGHKKERNLLRATTRGGAKQRELSPCEDPRIGNAMSK